MPEWVWIVLAIPTIGSVAFLLVVVGWVGARDLVWRRRARRRPARPVLRLVGRPPASASNGGVRQPKEQATKGVDDAK